MNFHGNAEIRTSKLGYDSQRFALDDTAIKLQDKVRFR